MTIFHASAHRYEANHRDSIQANAREAVIHGPNGIEEPGVVLGLGDSPRIVLTHEAAFRIAQDMADILTRQKAVGKA